MFRRLVLPMIILLFGLFSLMTLKSIEPTLLSKQAAFFLIGGAIFYFTSRIPFPRWLQLSPYFYATLVFLLLMTHLIGQVTRGATSWIPILGFHVQPSQLAVVWVGLFLSWFLSQRSIKNLKTLAAFTIILIVPAFLIFIEPELGTTIVYMIALGSLFFLSDTKISFILASIIGVAAFSLISWNFLLHPYQKDRITSFLNAQENSTGAGYNAQQALIAVGSGEFYGRGIGQGVQSHLRFLPERQTDFVFASFSEEMGLVGALPVVFLYAALAFFIIFVGLHAESDAEKYFCFVTATMIAVQSGINIGMNMGLLPITGITLPFFSYGGSSILSLCFQLGCVQSILFTYHKKTALIIG